MGGFTEFSKKKSLFKHWTIYKIKTTHVFGVAFNEELLALVDKYINIEEENEVKKIM